MKFFCVVQTFFYLFLGLAFAEQNQLQQHYGLHRCFPQLLVSLAEWSTHYEWRQQMVENNNKKYIVSPIEKIGETVTVWQNGAELMAMKSGTQLEFNLKLIAPLCKPLGSISAIKSQQIVKKNQDFTDEDLQQLLQKNTTGIIFAYSEHMHLSVLAKDNIKKAAVALKLPLLFLLDPEIKASKKDLKLASSELILRGMTIHYPSVVIYHQSKISSDALVGFKSQEQYQQFIEEKLR